MRTCPKCDRPNPPTRTTCWGCGNGLGAPDPMTVGSTPSAIKFKLGVSPLPRERAPKEVQRFLISDELLYFLIPRARIGVPWQRRDEDDPSTRRGNPGSGTTHYSGQVAVTDKRIFLATGGLKTTIGLPAAIGRREMAPRLGAPEVVVPEFEIVTDPGLAGLFIERGKSAIWEQGDFKPLAFWKTGRFSAVESAGPYNKVIVEAGKRQVSRVSGIILGCVVCDAIYSERVGAAQQGGWFDRHFIGPAIARAPRQMSWGLEYSSGEDGAPSWELLTSFLHEKIKEMLPRLAELRNLTVQPASEVSTGYCTKCGAPRSFGAKFCPKCGVALE